MYSLIYHRLCLGRAPRSNPLALIVFFFFFFYMPPKRAQPHSHHLLIPKHSVCPCGVSKPVFRQVLRHVRRKKKNQTHKTDVSPEVMLPPESSGDPLARHKKIWRVRWSVRVKHQWSRVTTWRKRSPKGRAFKMEYKASLLVLFFFFSSLFFLNLRSKPKKVSQTNEWVN